MALVVRLEVGDEQDRQAGVVRDILQQLGERLQPTGRGADADDRERRTGRRGVWRMLLGSAPEIPAEVGDLEASALIEIGNIINSSFLNAISDMTNLSLHATPPVLAIEMAGAILDAVVVEASANDHVALAIRTQIFDEEGTMDGYFAYIPSLGGLRTLFGTLGIAEAA